MKDSGRICSSREEWLILHHEIVRAQNGFNIRLIFLRHYYASPDNFRTGSILVESIDYVHMSGHSLSIRLLFSDKDIGFPKTYTLQILLQDRIALSCPYSAYLSVDFVSIA